MGNGNHGRDATCPAENDSKRENATRSGAGIFKSRTGGRYGGTEVVLQVLCERVPIHAGIFFLAGIRPCLPGRLVKRIDQFAMKISRHSLRRYCL
jgi:hypothetical protein